MSPTPRAFATFLILLANASGVGAQTTTSDEELLSRALERSLVRAGGVVLPPGVREVEPGLSFDYTRTSGLGIVGSSVAFQDFRRTTIGANLGLRVGLPWTLQVDGFLPYQHQRVETVTSVGSDTRTESGRGDYQLGLSKQLYAGTVAGLVGSVAYVNSRDSDSGLSALLGSPDVLSPAAAPSLGAGYDSVNLRLTGIRRLDPLVFLGSLGYAFSDSVTIAGAKVEPSNWKYASFRAILATSPEVSMRTGISLAHTGDMKVAGTELQGSGQTLAVLELGGSLLLTRSMLLDMAIGAGLTQDSPDFSINFSLPIRF